MYKKIVLVFLLLMSTLQLTLALEKPVTIRVNDTFISEHQAYLVQDDVVYADAKTIKDILDLTYAYNKNIDEYHFIKNLNRLSVRNNKITAYINGKMTVLDNSVDVVIKDEQLYMPLQFVVEFFGADYKWYNKYQFAQVNKPDVFLIDSIIGPEKDFRDDMIWLARIVNIEARDGSIDKKIAVGNVVLNRVKSSRFPNSVYDVIKQKGQFPPAYYSYFDTFEPSLEAFVGAYLVLQGVNNVEDCLYFNLKPFSWKPEEDFFGEIEGDYFYR